MKLGELRKQIKAGDTGPLYLLEGDDLQSRHDVAMEFTALVDEGLQAFNVQAFYANEATSAGARDQLIGDVLAAARTLPMMAPRRVLLVHEAEKLLSPRKGKDDEDAPVEPPAGRRRKSLTPVEALEEYLQAPEPLTTLVFSAGSLDGNRRLVKLARRQAAVVDCGTLDDNAAAAQWVKARLDEDAVTIEPRALKLLIDSTGRNLERLRAALDKLVLFASGEPAITMRHVQELVVPQSEPGADFALGRAIWIGDPRAALREIDAQLDNGAQLLQILGQLRAAAGSLTPEARARRALEAIFETDLGIKSSAGEGRFLIEKLVIEICAR